MVSHTGLAGLALGGGWGYMGRCMGLACDNILSVDIVTADGQLRTASKNVNQVTLTRVHACTHGNPVCTLSHVHFLSFFIVQDLFWAVRGAGPSFGVVTSFEFRCHPLPGPVYCGVMMYSWPRCALPLTHASA